MIAENLAAVRARMEAACRKAGRSADDVTLVAVSKRMPVERIQAALAAGQRIFGENYLQEAAGKIDVIQGARWHFIGHLQSNQSRQAAQLFDMVETVDRLKLAVKLNEHCARLGRCLDILLQVNVGREPQKSGVLPEDAGELAARIAALANLRLRGLMTIPPWHEDPERSRPWFRDLATLGQRLRQEGVLPENYHLSMGMSGDFEVAIEEGATIVRVGTALFGPRL